MYGRFTLSKPKKIKAKELKVPEPEINLLSPRLLGHERTETTTIYTRLNPDDLKQAIKKYHPRELLN